MRPSENRQIGLDDRGSAVARVKRAGFIGGDGDAGGVAELAVVEAERPVVPGADGAAVFDGPRGEVAAGVGAVVVDYADHAAVEKNRELKAADLDVLAPPFFELVQVAETRPGHGKS